MTILVLVRGGEWLMAERGERGKGETGGQKMNS